MSNHVTDVLSWEELCTWALLTAQAQGQPAQNGSGGAWLVLPPGVAQQYAVGHRPQLQTEDPPRQWYAEGGMAANIVWSSRNEGRGQEKLEASRNGVGQWEVAYTGPQHAGTTYYRALVYIRPDLDPGMCLQILVMMYLRQAYPSKRNQRLQKLRSYRERMAQSPADKTESGILSLMDIFPRQLQESIFAYSKLTRPLLVKGLQSMRSQKEGLPPSYWQKELQRRKEQPNP